MKEKSKKAKILRWAKKKRAIDLLGGKCECGVSDIVCLEFHHVDGNKELNMTKARDLKWSLIEQEVVKCELVCRNCHAKKHFFDKGSENYEFKLRLLEIIGSKECSICGYSDNIGSLDFHHRDPSSKLFNLGNAIRIINDDIGLIVSEIKKCDLVCKNCHLKLHQEGGIPTDREIKESLKLYKERDPDLYDKIRKMDKEGFARKRIAEEIPCTYVTIRRALGSKWKIKKEKQ